MFARESHRNFLWFSFVMLLVGAAVTVAVAWGCRWAAQPRHKTLDVSRWWNVETGPFSFEVTPSAIGQDGREYHLSLDASQVGLIPPETAPPDDLQWRDFGIQWISVYQPLTDPDWAPSAEPEQWIPERVSWIPFWTTVDEEPLTKVGGLIELAAGWPWPALWTQHRPSEDTTDWFAITTVSRGSYYGFLPFSEMPQQILYQPIWRGFLAGSLFWGGLLGTLLCAPGMLLRFWRTRRRRKREHCVQCNYPLRGLTAARCSECGWPQGQSPETPWRGAVKVGYTVLGILVITELSVAVAVRAQPEVTALEHAAFSGDLDAMRKQLARQDQGMGWYWPRHLVYGISSPMSKAVSSRAMFAAMVGGQIEAIELLLVETGDGLPGLDEPVSNELLWVVVRMHGKPELVRTLIRKYDLYDPARLDKEGRGLAILPSLLAKLVPDDDSFTIMLEQMERSPERHEWFWPGVMRGALRAQDAEVVEELVKRGYRVTSLRSIPEMLTGMDLVRFIVRWGVQDDEARDMTAHRIALARQVIEQTRVPAEGLVGEWTSILGTNAINEALFEWDGDYDSMPDAAKAALELLLEYGISHPVDPVEIHDFWVDSVAWNRQTHGSLWIWEAVVAYGVDPQISDDSSATPLILRSVVEDDVDGALVQFLLDHGVQVDRMVYAMASDPVREVLDAWLKAQCKTAMDLPK